jgi:formylglycine-generating enzyme required for sulfatase activity
MKHLLQAAALWLLLLTLVSQLATAHAQGTAFTYQGRLNSGGSPASGLYDFVFSLSNAPSGGSQVGGSVTNLAVGVTNGLFTTTLDFGAVFTGNDTWLAISVRTNGTGGYAGLTPLQPLTPTPYAVMAGSASQLGSLVVQQNASGAPNLIGGAPFNFASSGVYGATISGGGGTNVHYGPVAHLYTNSVIGSFGTVGGGADNTASGGATVGGGQNNSASGSASTVAGDSGNTASGFASTVAGGSGNTASGSESTVGGGSQNSASDNATVGGGNNNQATNVFATVPGGYSNVAGGQSSFAAGTYAQALHLGAFVWSDAELTPFASTAPNQFNVRANGGVNFFTSGAGMTLDGQALATATPPGMATIPAGSFTMGNSIGDGDIANATPTNITVSAFYMDINLVTYAQWQSVYFWATSQGYGLGHAGAGKAANHPVQTVNWYDAVKWSNARSQQAGLTPVYYTDADFTQVYMNGDVDAVYAKWAANGYRLPTEAEWEKAARGGLSGQRFPWGNVITENLANYYGATASYPYDLGPDRNNPAFTNGVGPYTSPAGYFAPNGYGLYDMAGNVAEWCWDWYGTPYGQPSATNPTGPATGSYRVLRGGNWNDYAYYARCAVRYVNIPNSANSVNGFRCVRGH